MASSSKRLIRVLYTIPNFDTAGSGKALLNIAKRLDPARFEPHIACFHGEGVFFQQVERSGIPVHFLPFTVLMRPVLKGLKGCWEIGREFRKIAPDIIHSFHYASDYSEPIGARLAGVKWVYTKKNMSWRGPSYNSWRLRSWLANGILAQNTDMLRDFFPNWEKVRLVPRGVDTQVFHPREKDRELSAQLGISGNCRVLMVVANLVPVKGVETAIHALKTLTDEPSFSDLFLVIVGDDLNPYGEKMKGLAKNSGLSNRILFTGKRQDVNKLLALADLFILPTLNEGRKEGCPVALLEAMASGVPVVGSRVPGIVDQLSPMPDQLFAPGDPADLANAIRKLFALDSKSIISRQIERIQSTYSIGQEVHSHESFYESLF